MFGRIKPEAGHYQVHEQLLAGGYPGGWNGRNLNAGLRQMLDAGVTFFLDLTEDGEKRRESYTAALRVAARSMGRTVEHCRAAIPDFETPTPEQMRDILDVLDAALADGHTVYVHCYAGLGRTGTVIGCYLVRHGRSGQEALDELGRLRQGTALADMYSPVTEEQRRLVYRWAVLDKTQR